MMVAGAGRDNSITRKQQLPPGFRFHPTDEELIVHYLKNQAASRPCPVSIIPQVNIYKFDPWHLPDKAGVGENEWYFFTPRDRKYPNGARPNRAAVSGYWKATGTDKAIYSGSKYVGVKKALVFYKGKPPKGIKTNWIMHEYRLSESRTQPSRHNGSMRLDDWVLCRIYKKKNLGRSTTSSCDDHPQQHLPSFPQIGSTPTNNTNAELLQQPYKFSRNNNSYLTHLWDDQFDFSFSRDLLQGNRNEGFLQTEDDADDQKYHQLGQHLQQLHDNYHHQTMFSNAPDYEFH